MFPSHHFRPPHIIDEAGVFFIAAALFLVAFSILAHNVKYLAGDKKINVFVWIGRVASLMAFILFGIGFFI